MKSIVLLADSAQISSDRKLHALGLGWTVTSTPTPPATIVIWVIATVTEAKSEISLRLELVSAHDGAPFMIHSSEGPVPLQIAGKLAVTPVGPSLSAPLMAPLVFPLPPGLELVAGQTYKWQIHLNDETHPDWSAEFDIVAT